MEPPQDRWNISLKTSLESHFAEETRLRRRTMGGPIMSAKPQHAATTSDAIHQFHVNVPESELTELRRRINATKWPERETVADASQGVQLTTMQALARYWATEYNWRKDRKSVV